MVREVTGAYKRLTVDVQSEDFGMPMDDERAPADPTSVIEP